MRSDHLEKSSQRFRPHSQKVLAMLTTVLSLVTASANCPVATAEYGTVLLELANSQPAEFTLVEQEAPADYNSHLSAIFYCTVRNQYLAGFTFTYGSSFNQKFGDVQGIEPGTVCNTILVDEWINRIQYFWSADDGLLGFRMIGDGTTDYLVQAAGSGLVVVEQSPVIELAGPPIGFKVLFGQSFGRANTPQAMQTMINECACDFSSYLLGQDLRDMNTESVSGTTDVQTLQKQDNFITKLYGQDCGAYTVTIHPEHPFLSVVKDPATSQFSIKLQSLQSQIRKYRMELTVQNENELSIMAPVKYNFDVFIHPCQLDSVNIIPPDSVTFDIGSDAKELPYSFFQIPNCQYPTGVFFSGNQPAYMEHKIKQNSIIFPREQNLNYAGTYEVEMGVRVYSPADYTYTIVKISTFQASFTIEIVDPCPRSQILPFNVDPVEIRVFLASAWHILNIQRDSISEITGNSDGHSFCGARRYDFYIPSLPFSTVVTFNEASRVMSFQSSKLSEVGKHQVAITVSLDGYPQIKRTVNFDLQILPCQIHTLTPVAYADQTYNLYDSITTYEFAEFVLFPPCGYTVDYEFSLLQPFNGNIPPFMSVPTPRTIDVQTDDVNDLGIYTIKITGRVDDVQGQTFTSPIESSTTLSIVVINGCVKDIVQPISISEGRKKTYVIGQDSIVTVPLAWSHSILSCPMKYEYSKEDPSNGAQLPLNSDELTVLQFVLDTQAMTNQVQISTSDYVLDQQLWKLKISLKSVYSEIVEENLQLSNNDAASTKGSSASYFLELSFVDKCWLSDLRAGEFSFTERSYDLFQIQILQYSTMVDLSNGFECGGYTYSLNYVSGPVYDSLLPGGADFSFYQTLGTNTMHGKAEPLIWIGLHTIRLRCTLGTSGNVGTNTRGQAGLFNSVYSEPITLIINNPCATTRVNQLQFPTLTVPSGLTLLQYDTLGPSNTASVTYGNGFDKCGPLKYTLENSFGNVLDLKWLSMSVRTMFTKADQIRIELQSEDEGLMFNHEFFIRAQLQNYPTVEPEIIPLQVVFRGCWVDQFKATKIDDLSVDVGQDPLQVAFNFDQNPCDFNMEVLIIVTQEDGLEVFNPDFLYLTPDGFSLIVEATESDQIGRYSTRIMAILDDVQATTSSIDFILVIREQSQSTTDYKAPDLPDPEVYIFIHTLRVNIDHSPITRTKPNINAKGTFGFLSDRGLDLGQYELLLQPFISYDLLKNEILVDVSTAAGSAEIGMYNLTFWVTYYNETYEYRANTTFNLNLMGTSKEEQENNRGDGQSGEKTQTDIDQFQWNGKVVDKLKMGEFDPDAPIPTLYDITQTGLVTINFDQPLEVPKQSQSVITNTWIALKEKAAHIDFGIGQGMPAPEAIKNDQYKFIGALELRIAPRDCDLDNDSKISFTWHIVSFDATELRIQLNIDEPEAVSEAGSQDALYITFFEPDLFRARLSGKSVRFGTRLSSNLSRMMSEEDKELVDDLALFKSFSITSVALSVPAMIVGDTIATFLFVHSLQLVAHTSLLNSAMPGNIQYFMRDYLSLVRLRSPVYDESGPYTDVPRQPQQSMRLLQSLGFADENSSVKDDRDQSYQGAYNARFQQNGYALLQQTNLVVVLYILLVLAILWLFCELKDFIIGHFYPQQRQKKIWWARRHAHYLSNALIRFFYFMFLELAICFFLNISIPDLQDENHSSAGANWFTSLSGIFLILAAIVALVCLCSRAKVVPNFYQKGTYWYSHVGIRPLRNDLESYAVDGKGSDDVWESYINKRQARDIIISEVSALVQDPISSKKIALMLKVFDDLEAPPLTNRGLLNEDLDGDQGANGTDPAILKKIIDLNQHQFSNTLCQSQRSTISPPALDNPSPEPLGATIDLNTDINHDSLEIGAEKDQTVPQIEDDQVVAPVDQEDSKGVLSIYYEGGNRETIVEEFKSAGDKGDAAIDNESIYVDMVDKGTSMRNLDDETDYQQKRALYLRRLARKRQTFFDQQLLLKAQDCRYRTIWNGLRVNHERNVAFVYPIVFMMRRIVYALLVTAFATFSITSTLTFVVLTLLALSYVINEHPWVHWLHNQHHIVNEVFLYTFSIILLTFGGFFGEFGASLGWLYITIFCFFIVYNMIMVMRFASRALYVASKTFYIRHIRKHLPQKWNMSKAKLSEKLQQNESVQSSSSSDLSANKSRDKDAECSEIKDKKNKTKNSFVALREISCQTDLDYGGLFHRIQNFLHDRFNSQNHNTNGGFFGNDDANELSFGREKQDELNEEENLAMFGGVQRPELNHTTTQVALKTLDPHLMITGLINSDYPPQSPQRSDIFNKSGEKGHQTQASNTNELLLNYENIPIKLDERGSEKSVDSQQLSSIKRRDDDSSNASQIEQEVIRRERLQKITDVTEHKNHTQGKNFIESGGTQTGQVSRDIPPSENVCIGDISSSGRASCEGDLQEQKDDDRRGSRRLSKAQSAQSALNLMIKQDSPNSSEAKNNKTLTKSLHLTDEEKGSSQFDQRVSLNGDKKKLDGIGKAGKMLSYKSVNARHTLQPEGHGSSDLDSSLNLNLHRRHHIMEPTKAMEERNSAHSSKITEKRPVSEHFSDQFEIDRPKDYLHPTYTETNLIENEPDLHRRKSIAAQSMIKETQLQDDRQNLPFRKHISQQAKEDKLKQKIKKYGTQHSELRYDNSLQNLKDQSKDCRSSQPSRKNSSNGKKSQNYGNAKTGHISIDSFDDCSNYSNNNPQIKRRISKMQTSYHDTDKKNKRVIKEEIENKNEQVSALVLDSSPSRLGGKNKTKVNKQKSSILSDWDDMVEPQSNLERSSVFHSKKITIGKRKQSLNQTSEDDHHELCIRYGLHKEPVLELLERKKSSSIVSVSGRSQYKTIGVSNAFDLATPTVNSGLGTTAEAAVSRDVSLAITTKSNNRATIRILASSISGNIQNSVRVSQKPRCKIKADMVVPIDLDGQLTQIGPSKAKKTAVTHRSNQMGSSKQDSNQDFSMYANAYGNKFSHLDRNCNLQGAGTNVAVGALPNPGPQTALQRSSSRNHKIVKQESSSPDLRSGIKARAQFLYDMPLNIDSPTVAAGTGLNFQLGGNGTLAQQNRRSIQNRMTNIKQSKLFQTVMDVREDQIKSSCDMQQDNSFSRNNVNRMPHQSQYANQDYTQRSSTSQIRLNPRQPQHQKLIPDVTSEGNRVNLLRSLFFPNGPLGVGGSLSPSKNNRQSQELSRRSSSMLSASIGSVSMGPATQLRMSNIQRLDANKAAAQSMLKSGCRGRRTCTVSDQSSIE